MKLTDPCFDVLNELLFYAKMVARNLQRFI